MTRQSTLGIAASVMALAGAATAFMCTGSGSSGDAFRAVIERCAAGDQLKNVMFFSFSNNIGPGSVWKKTPDNGYIAVRLFPTVPETAGVINHGVASPCNGSYTAHGGYDTDIGVAKLMSVMPAGITGKIGRARAIVVSAESVGWDDVLDGTFRDMLSALEAKNANDGYVRDVRQAGLIVGRALRVDGMSADLSFDRDAAAELHASYPAGVELTGKLHGTWADTTTLKIKLTQPAYVGVQMYRWTPQGLSGRQLIAQAPDANARMVADSTASRPRVDPGSAPARND